LRASSVLYWRKEGGMMYTPAWFSTMQEIILQIYVGNLFEIKVTQKENMVRVITFLGC